MKYHLSFDDYCDENFRLAKLLLKYDLKALFFVECRKNGESREAENQIKTLSKLGFEIGSHTIDHSLLNELTTTEEYEEELYLQLGYSKSLLEDFTGKPIEWLCPPRGRYNDIVLSVAKEVGYQYVRSTKVRDTDDIKKGINHTTVHVYPRKEYGDIPWLEIAKVHLFDVKDGGGTFKLWGHGWEIEKLGEWDNLEYLLRLIKASL